MKTTLLSKVKTSMKWFYNSVEAPFKPPHIPFGGDKDYIQYRKMNNLMKKIYKQEALMITDYENIQYKEFTSKFDNKRLSGIIYTPNKNSKKWVVTCHWFSGNKWWGLYHAKAFVEMGYNVIAFDFRGHGNSEFDTPTLGIKETWDLLGVLDYVKDNIEYDKLALMGTSMGSFIVNYASIKYAKEMKEYKVDFGISDCPYGSMESLFMHERNLYLKFVPKRRTKKWVYKTINKENKFEGQYDVDLYSANMFKALDEGAIPAFPILFSHSKNDMLTPITDTYQLVLDRSLVINGDELNVYNYCMHTQALRVHFKRHVSTIARYIARNDGDWKAYASLVDRWQLNKVITKQDLKSAKLA